MSLRLYGYHSRFGTVQAFEYSRGLPGTDFLERHTKLPTRLRSKKAQLLDIQDMPPLSEGARLIQHDHLLAA